MPILGWTRTDLEYRLSGGSKAMRFDHIAFAAFEIHILKRPGAAGQRELSRRECGRNIIAGLPGAEEGESRIRP